MGALRAECSGVRFLFTPGIYLSGSAAFQFRADYDTLTHDVTS